jgi:hypothetical protein
MARHVYHPLPHLARSRAALHQVLRFFALPNDGTVRTLSPSTMPNRDPGARRPGLALAAELDCWGMHAHIGSVPHGIADIVSNAGLPHAWSRGPWRLVVGGPSPTCWRADTKCVLGMATRKARSTPAAGRASWRRCSACPSCRCRQRRHKALTGWRKAARGV